MKDIPEDVIETARKYAGGEFAYPEVMKAIALAIMAERERCAKIADCGCDDPFCELDAIAAKIRGET